MQNGAPLVIDPNVEGGRSRRLYVLALITGVYLMHALDRAIGGIVLEPVRHEFGLTDAQLGLIGLAFGVAFAMGALPVGLVIDRFPRRFVLPAMLTAWSLATAAAGFVQSAAGLIATRAAVGLAEAGGNPASISLMSDTFPPARRGTAVGIMLVGSAAGVALAGIMGAYLSEHYGWRIACFAAGVPGLLLALLFLLTVTEPHRGALDNARSEQAPKLEETVKYIVRRRTLVHLFIATTLGNGAMSSMATWATSFYTRVHNFTLAEAGVALAVTIGPGMAVGSAGGGWLSDRIGRDSGARRLWVCAALPFVALPCVIAGLTVAAPTLSLALLLAANMFMPGYLPGATAMILNVTPPGMRGVTVAARQLVANLLGFALGPFIVGQVSDMMGADDQIRYALAITVSVLLLATSIHIWRAAASSDRDVDHMRRYVARERSMPAGSGRKLGGAGTSK